MGAGNDPGRTVVERHVVEQNDGIENPPVFGKELGDVGMILLVAIALVGVAQIGSVKLELAQQIL